MPDIDISVLGDEELARRFKRLPEKIQKKVVRPAVRNGAKRSKDRIANQIKARGLVRTGNMFDAFKRTKVRTQSRNPRKLIRVGPVLPTREELGIDPDDKFYYPMALEKRFHFMRDAIDKFKQQEFRELARDIGRGIKRIAKR